jgi:hypothetical protein
MRLVKRLTRPQTAYYKTTPQLNFLQHQGFLAMVISRTKKQNGALQTAKGAKNKATKPI